MTDYMKIRKAFFASKLDLHELEALKGLVESEIRYEEQQLKLWTIEGKYRGDLRDQFTIIKLAIEAQNYRVSADRPRSCENCCTKWCLVKSGSYYGDLQLRSDGTWAMIPRSGDTPSLPERSLTELMVRRQIDVTNWKLAS